jgi:valyl-tRNA synthetase
MELSKNYIPASVEEKWNRHWHTKGYFSSKPDNRRPYTVVIPPPNVTGVLHMGHTLNETVQDILVRKARMNGFNACWVPGSDHASIATEAKVVDMLKKEKGIDKNQLTREEFLKHAFEWKDKYGGIIYKQIEKLGCSVDWNRVTFTMDDHYYEAVIKVFVDLYKKGLIYRGARMINWDPQAKTALSDEEVEYKEITGKLYYIKYYVEGSDEYIVIATQRPETIMGDTAVCVNPNDARYFHLQGKSVVVPLINKTIPVITDEYVDLEFGTGALKVTPAHDINDYNLGLKHNLPIVDTLNDDGTLSEAARIYVGVERFAARKQIIAELTEKGLLEKEESYQTRIGYSQRTNAIAEPKISTQWFVKMKDLAGPALDAVVSGGVHIHPGDKFLATYKYWLENVKDWCISRQLWWGQQIPAWYDDNGNMVVAENEAEAIVEMQKIDGEGKVVDNLRRDEDVMDTWFSSWLWPIEVFKGITQPGNDDIRYYYPTSVLVTGQDIIFFWVARMIMAGMEFMNEKPFSDVYFTGMVRDNQGRKMSKQLGNSPDLLDLIDRYGADSVRFGIMIASPAGNDLLFDESSLEQGRNFNNKMWNALKLMKIWEGKLAPVNPLLKTLSGNSEQQVDFAVDWFKQRLNQVRIEVEKLFNEFRLSEALKMIYSLIWDDFCSWYLEWVKPGQDETLDRQVYDRTIAFYEELLQLLHPFMPFITEEIYHELREQTTDLTVKYWPERQPVDDQILTRGFNLKQLISSVRDLRNKHNIKPKEQIRLYIQAADKSEYQQISSLLEKQLNASTIKFTDSQVPNTITIVIGKEKLYVETTTTQDTSVQKDQLVKDLEYLKGFLNVVDKKLSNERFVQNAKPEVVDLERKKKADAEEKIRLIEESLSSL